MTSKTPKFDKALDEILKNLKPHTRKCAKDKSANPYCMGEFEIFAEDIEFYKMLRVPPQKLCPECRKQRRYGFYNNILQFHRRECDSHTNEQIISTFTENSPYKTYNLKYWWSDKWDPFEYGRDYDFSRPFFEQFKAFNLSVPQPAITHYWRGVINSSYSISIVEAKDCYFSSIGSAIENVHYSTWIGRCRDCMELLNVDHSENSYELINCSECYNCHFCQMCSECIDGYFLYRCRNCQNCFGCTNLRNKSYCFFNEQLTKEEYEKRMKEIDLGDREVLEKYRKKFEEVRNASIMEATYVDPKNINSVGDQLWEAKDCHHVFRGDFRLENLRYCVDVAWGVKDSMDLWVVGPNIKLSYELIESYDSSQIKFSFFVRDGLDLEYCIGCHGSKYCFGSIGLRNKQYCIFNKQYSEDGYWQKLDDIKTEMLQNGEYGEFFLPSMALHPYNETYAMIEHPLGKEQVLEQGLAWHDQEDVDLKGLKTIKVKNLSLHINEIKDDILDKAVVCEVTGRPFRIIKSELDFYRSHNLPIPTKHPYQRMLERFDRRNPPRLWGSRCTKCGKEVDTAFPPEKQKELKIYCRECYLKEVV